MNGMRRQKNRTHSAGVPSPAVRTYLITYKFNHHYSASGYSRLAEFLPCRNIAVPAPLNTLVGKLATQNRREELRRITGLLGYFPECVWLERYAGMVMKRSGRAVFHFIYPENSYFFTASSPRATNTKIVATYHQPVNESR